MPRFEYSEKALEILRNLQGQGSQDNPYDPVVENASPDDLSRWSPPIPMPDEEREEFVKTSVEIINESKKSLPTELEDPAAYSIFRQLLERLVPVAKQLHYPLPDRISFGTINTLSLNAHVIPIDDENNEVLLVFNRMLIPFCYTFAGFLAYCLNPSTSGPGNDIRLGLDDRNPTSEELLLLHDIVGDSIRRFERHYDTEGEVERITFDRIAPRRRISVTYPVTLIRQILLEAIESFAVGHELVHLVLLRASRSAKWKEASVSLGAVQDSYSDEHLCDTMGQMLALYATLSLFPGVPQSLLYPLCVVSGPIFLACLRITEKATHLVRTGVDLPEEIPDFAKDPPKGYETHPPTFLRMRYLGEVIKRDIGPQVNSRSVDALSVYSWTDRFLEQAWTKLEDTFRGYYRPEFSGK